jgi:calcium-dependent protein kinase
MGQIPCCGSTTTDTYAPIENDVSPYSGIPYAPVRRTSSLTPLTPSRFVVQSFHSIEDSYMIDKVLGSGAYGVVCKAVHKKTGELRAIKFISRKKVKTQTESELLSEIDILKHLDHPNIMKIFEFSANVKGYYIVSEYLPGGELFDVIAKRKQFSEVDAASIMRQLIGAISYCHSKHVMHRDLKPENILIDAIEGDMIYVKIVDFGNALFCPPNKAISEKVGSIYYVAPEILNGHHTYKCDVWSLGVIMYILLSGRVPFNGSSEKKIFKDILKGSFSFPSPLWDRISKEAKDLITKMLTYNPDKRIAAAEAYNHPWFKICELPAVDPIQAKEILQNLKGLNRQTKLQKAAMMFIVTQLMTKEERDQLTDVFIAFDKNGDGKLTHEELISAYKFISDNKLVASREIEELLKETNFDKNIKINYSEFLVAAANKKKLLTLENIKEAFAAFDVNKNGYITPEELKTVLGPGKKLDEKVWKKIIAEVDTKELEKISYDEFEHLLMNYTLE